MLTSVELLTSSLLLFRVYLPSTVSPGLGPDTRLYVKGERLVGLCLVGPTYGQSPTLFFAPRGPPTHVPWGCPTTVASLGSGPWIQGQQQPSVLCLSPVFRHQCIHLHIPPINLNIPQHSDRRHSPICLAAVFDNVASSNQLSPSVHTAPRS